MKEISLDLILLYLNENHVRATYGAVAEIIGTNAQNVGRRLGDRTPEASWVVNTDTGWPSGYHGQDANKHHPALSKQTRLIRTGEELRSRISAWMIAKSEGSRAELEDRKQQKQQQG